MALKSTICAALAKTETALNCSSPVTPVAQKVCPAIVKSKLALGCGGAPFSCTINEDCGPTQYCNAGTCTPKNPIGSPCLTGAECQVGLVCGSGYMCAKPSNPYAKKPGESCTVNSDCRSNYCIIGSNVCG